MARSKSSERVISSPELERIKSSNQHTATQTLRSFVWELLTDVRIMVFLGSSLLLILLLSAVVSRWSRD